MGGFFVLFFWGAAVAHCVRIGTRTHTKHLAGGVRLPLQRAQPLPPPLDAGRAAGRRSLWTLVAGGGRGRANARVMSFRGSLTFSSSLCLTYIHHHLAGRRWGERGTLRRAGRARTMRALRPCAAKTMCVCVCFRGSQGQCESLGAHPIEGEKKTWTLRN